MNTARALPWPSIAALNAVSALAQIGQFGVGFAVLPLWLAHRGLGVAELGLFAALQWTGMLVGLYAARPLMARWGARATVYAGLLASIAAFVLSAMLRWPGWLLPAGLFGLGIGLRWIANETWLYRLIPEHLAGRVTGVHETLISLAELLGPLLVLWCGVADASLLWSGAIVTVFACVPLFGMGNGRTLRTTVPQPSAAAPASRLDASARLGIGAAIACGLSCGALYALFPKFCGAWGLSSESCARLLTMVGLGGVVLQWLIGWLIDRCGVRRVTVGCATFGLISAVGLRFGMTHDAWAMPAAFMFGGTSQALLTVGMATAAAARAQLDRMMRFVSVGFTLGSIAGPLLAAAAIEAAGVDALMWLIEGLCFGLIVYAFGVYRVGRAATLYR